MTDIKIGRLEIRMKGISPEDARATISGLPEELARQIAAREDMIKGRRGIKINKIEPEALEIGKDNNPPDLRTKIAGRIMSSIAAKIK